MQLYIYEYTEDSDVAQMPQQICPYAMVDYSYTPASDDGRMRSSVRFVAIAGVCWM